MEKLEGIIDKRRNPFICSSWIKQDYGFTNHRKVQLKYIVGMNESEIKKLP
jgi:hypothetical protein